MGKYLKRKKIACFAIIAIMLIAIVLIGCNNNFTDFSNSEITLSKNFNGGVIKDFQKVESEDYAYADLPQGQIKLGQEYQITIKTSCNKPIEDYKYTYNDFTIVSSIVIDNSLVLTLKNNAITDDAFLNIEIYLNDGTVLKYCIFSIVNEDGVFLSQHSKDSAYRNYLEYSLGNGIIDEKEYFQKEREFYASGIIEERYTIQDSSSFSNAQSSSAIATAIGSADTYIRGRLQWKDDYNVSHDLRGVKVEIYDHDGIYSSDDLIGTTYSDDEGNYSYAFNNMAGSPLEINGLDLYIKVYPGDDNVELKNSNNKYVYTSTIGEHMDVATGSTTVINLLIDMSTDLGQAFQISQAIMTARDFAENMMDTEPTKVTVLYPSGTNGCSYSNNTIKICNSGEGQLKSYASWDVLMHEYGHHVQHQLQFTSSPGGTHYFGVNMADELQDKSAAIRLVYAESWASVFGNIAQEYYSQLVGNIQYNCDHKYNSYNGANCDYETPSNFAGGEACESSVCAALWDIYDDDDFDETIELQYYEWWAVTTAEGTNIFSNFVSNFYSDFPEYRKEFGKVLSSLKIASGAVLDLYYILPDTPPAIFWMNQGGSERFYNNDFVLRIYNENATDYIDINTHSESNSANSLIAADISQNQWNTVLSWSCQYVQMTVISYQKDSPQTGGYFSEYITIEKPVFKTVKKDDDTLSITGTYCPLWQTVTIPESINNKTVTEIGDYAFKNQYDLFNVTLPSTIERIGDGAFQSCESLMIIDISSTKITEINDYCFESTIISNIEFPETLKSINDYAFKFTKFVGYIPDSVESIGNNAFENSTGSSIIIPDSVVNMGQNVFKNCEDLTLYLEHDSIPSSWSSIWNSTSRPVVLGCNLSSDGSYVVSVTKTDTSIKNAANGLSSPYRRYYNFAGWYQTADFTGTKYTDLSSAPNGTLYAKWQESCIAEGSMITLSDGTQKAVEDLTGNEELLVWNMFTGEFDSAPILFIDSDPENYYEVINLYFSDGTSVKVISEHAFWDVDLNEYVFLRSDAAQYIGHRFNKQTVDDNGNMVYTEVQLTNVIVQQEYTSAWSPVTYGYLCYYVNGMLSMPGATEGLINIFEVDPDTMTIDQEAYLEDIEEYGLFTYEEFNALCPISEEVFNAFGGQYLKVSLGKGLITWDELESLIARYSEFWN